MENYLSFNRLCLSLLFVASFVLMTATFSQPASAAVAVGVGPAGTSLYVTGQPYYGYGYYHRYGGYHGGAGGGGYYHRGSTYYGGHGGGAYHGGTTYRNGNVYHHGGYYHR